MNPEKLKQLFGKVQTWVKKNPKKAALVGVVIGIIVYFAIKQGAESDGESIGGGEPASDASGLDSFGAGLGAGGGGESASASGGSGSGGSGGGSDGGLSGDSTPLSNVTGSDMTSAGGFDSSSFGFGESFLPELPASGFVNSSPAIPASSASIVSSSPAAAVGVGAIKPVKINRDTSPAPTSAAAAVGVGAINPPKIVRDNKPAPVSKPAPAVAGGSRGTSGNASKTDAEKAGLSKYFTGVSGGKRYAAGRFVGMVSTVTNKPTAR
jgi:hypothetical protein